ncbi:MAG: hypothetical protein WCA78_15565 [Rhizomicrobium sp.]
MHHARTGAPYKRRVQRAALLEFDAVDLRGLRGEAIAADLGELAPVFRDAVMIVSHTKPELVDELRKLTADAVEHSDGGRGAALISRQLQETAERLRDLATLCEAARSRLVVAGCAVEVM